MSPVKIGTHDGVFHCDEVLSCVMLKLLPRYRDADILRTRDQASLDECAVVVDVGGEFDPTRERYDNHMLDFSMTMNQLSEGKIRSDTMVASSVETNLFFERIRISNLIRNLEIFRIRIRILFVVRKFSNPNPNIRDSGKKIRIRIRIWRNILIIQIIE